MAGIFQNGVWSTGFDLFGENTTLAVGGVWDSVNSSPTVKNSFARFSSTTNAKGCQFTLNQFAGRSFNSNVVTHIAGFAYQPVLLPTGSGISVVATYYDATQGTSQCCLGIDNSGNLHLYLGNGFGVGAPSGAGLATSTTALIPGSWVYLETKCTIDASNGVFQVRLNGNSTPILNYSGSLKNTTNNWVSRFLIGSAGNSAQTQLFDDIYLLDTTGAAPLNTFLGNVYCQTDVPNANGSFAAWTPTSGTNFQNVDLVPPGAQSNGDATVGDRDSYAFPALPATALTVLFVNQWASVEQDAAGTRQLSLSCRSNSVDAFGSSINLPQTYTYFNTSYGVDPNTNSPWVVTGVNAAEFGVKTTA